MGLVGIGIDYSNICKDYNTAYLDRDNTDPATNKCMKQVLTWTESFLSDLLKEFSYQLHNLNSSIPLKVSDVASKRFLFYSLEKEITLQSYVIDSVYNEYDGLAHWEQSRGKSILIKNDEDGGAIYLYLNSDSKELAWIQKRLQEFTLDEVPFSTTN